MKIALVHDYLAQDVGAERVLEVFHQIWPKAPIFVLFHDKKKLPQFNNADIRQSFIAKLPFGKTKYQWYLPWMPLATERHNVNDFDIVLSSTSAFAKGILTRPDAIHISYCHTPTRYLWTDMHSYIADLRYNKLIKAALPKLIHKMRIWDKSSVDRVDEFIANSRTVKNRIKKFYRRNSDVIYPPVDTTQFYISENIRPYFITGGRLVPYKRFDLVVDVFNRLGIPLKIFGSGPELGRLKKMAKKNIQFLGRINEKEKAELLSKAKAFIHPQLEDLGITPIEAMASGRPVIAYGVGGATETIIPGKTGLFFHKQTWESLLDAVIKFENNNWNSQDIRNHAMRYDTELFKEKISSYVENKYQKFQQELNQCEVYYG